MLDPESGSGQWPHPGPSVRSGLDPGNKGQVAASLGFPVGPSLEQQQAVFLLYAEESVEWRKGVFPAAVIWPSLKPV